MADGLRTEEAWQAIRSAGRGRSLDELRRARRLCFFAHYHPLGIVADHVVLYLRALAEAGFEVVVLSTAELAANERDKLSAECATLVMRANTGLDFGGWIEAVQAIFPIEAEYLLFANDSVYGPVGDLSGFIDRLTATPADFYGAVESLEHGQHLQSWFLLFRPTAYRSAAFAELLGQPLPPELDKLTIIKRYEVGVTTGLRAAGLTYHAAYSPIRDGRLQLGSDFNASQFYWRELIEQARIPFLKIQLVRENPLRVRNISEWNDVVRTHAPALHAAIVIDLAYRPTDPSANERVNWWRTLGDERMFCWPELEGILRRDARLPPRSLAANANLLAYRSVRPLAQALRWTAIRLRWRLENASKKRNH